MPSTGIELKTLRPLARRFNQLIVLFFFSNNTKQKSKLSNRQPCLSITQTFQR